MRLITIVLSAALVSGSSIPASAQETVQGFAAVPWGADHTAIVREYGPADATDDAGDHTQYTYFDQRVGAAWPAALIFFVGDSTGLARGSYAFVGDSVETETAYRGWVTSVREEHPSLPSYECPPLLHERWGLSPTRCDYLVEDIPFSGDLLSAHVWSDGTTDILATWLKSGVGAFSHRVLLVYDLTEPK